MGNYFSKTISDETKPLAVKCLTNYGGLCILEIQHGIDDYVVHAIHDGDKYISVSRSKLKQTALGRDYFVRGNKKQYLDEFIRNEGV